MRNTSNALVRLTSFGNVFLVIVMLFSALGYNLSPVEAAPAGTALQFNGTNQHVTFGNTALTQGTLTATPSWQTQANSRLGSSSLLLNGTSQYVT